MTEKEEEQAEGRLSRWSRLKQGEGEEKLATAAPVAVSSTGEAAAVPETEEEIAPEDLPDIESMDAASDYTPFMQKGVPAHLKKMAMRKLWLSDPALANLDGLNDYDEDFSIIESIGNTIYRVGKGMLSDEDIEEEAKKAAAVEEETTSETEADPEGEETSGPDDPEEEEGAVDNNEGEDLASNEDKTTV